MPFIMGDNDSLPDEVRGYIPLIEAAPMTPGAVVYLSIHESRVEKGFSQRRGGIHTEGTNSLSWGGGSWGGGKLTSSGFQGGVVMGSTDGRCMVWDMQTTDVDDHGGLLEHPQSLGEVMEPSTLY